MDPSLITTDCDPTWTTLIAGGIGVLLGLAYAGVSWGRSSPLRTPLNLDPRVANLIWAIGAFLAGFLGRWDELGLCINRGLACVAYLGSFLVTALATIFAMGAHLYWQYRGYRRTNFHPVKEYILHGYDAARTELAKLPSGEAVGSDLASNIGLTSSVWEGTKTREDVEPRILKHILAIAHSRSPEFTGLRYMIAIDYATAPPEQQSAADPLWGFADASPGHLLVLHAVERGGRQGASTLILPVSIHEDTALPGAAEAFLSGDPVGMTNHRLRFRRLIPSSARDAFQRTLENATFKSTLSIPVGASGAPIGVVTLESTNARLFSGNKPAQERLSEELFPALTLVGTLHK